MIRNIRLATSAEDIEHARELMRNYARWTEIDLCFQNFEGELAALPGKYSAPEGGLWLAEMDSSVTLVGAEKCPPVGVVAVRALADSACELKRLWVEPEA